MRSPTQMEEKLEEKRELKYCEGCGALCLRPADSADIYCATCENKLPRTARALREADAGRTQ